MATFVGIARRGVFNPFQTMQTHVAPKMNPSLQQCVPLSFGRDNNQSQDDVNASLLRFNAPDASTNKSRGVVVSISFSEDMAVSLLGFNTLDLSLICLDELASFCADLIQQFGTTNGVDHQVIVAQHSLSFFWSIYYYCLVARQVKADPRDDNFLGACRAIANSRK